MSLEKKDGNVTIYDIAHRAEASASTVGAVMNGTWKSRRISEKRAELILSIASEMGYSRNMQASALRRERTHIIGMIIPMYNSRYFSSIAQRFEHEARARGLFPMVSCTSRDPELEQATVEQMLSYRVDQIVCTGATDPDAIATLCEKHGVPAINLDLPGSRGPSIISDNYQGAYDLTRGLLSRLRARDLPSEANLLFVGGRPKEHNTSERVRGFRNALKDAGVAQEPDLLLTCGYARHKAINALDELSASGRRMPAAIFVNSTESLEGVMRWFRSRADQNINDVSFGCFDWDPFATFINSDVLMVRQNVVEMTDILFNWIDNGNVKHTDVLEVQPTIVKAASLEAMMIED
ncbi:MAG: substrate-binding domain-containing protein [Stappiaceae bacterium]